MEKIVKLAILNTSIVTSDGTYTVESLTPERALSLVRWAIGGDGIDSAVGHPMTAGILTALLGVDIPVSRQLFAQETGQQALVFKLNGRPEPGKELSQEELEAIGFQFKLLTRTA
jgi:hypothetical protein